MKNAKPLTLPKTLPQSQNDFSPISSFFHKFPTFFILTTSLQFFQIYGRHFSCPPWQKGLLFTRCQSNGEILIYFKVMVIWWRGLNSNVNSFVRSFINSQITMNEIALHQSKVLSMNGFSDCARGEKKSEIRASLAENHVNKPHSSCKFDFMLTQILFRDRIDVNLLAREGKQFRMCWTPEFETLLINKAFDHVFVSMQKKLRLKNFEVLHNRARELRPTRAEFWCLLDKCIFLHSS